MPKVDAAINIAKRGQTIIYSSWKKTGINLISKELDKIKIPYSIISGDIESSKRQKISDSYNKGDIQVLLITKAGGEGLDLKGTNSIVLLEPVWNIATKEQIVARAIRFRSHAHLLPAQRVVYVYDLLMDNPIKKDESGKDRVESVDIIVEELANMKQKICDTFDKAIRTVSIKAC
jgi:SNF2 family DNA or RNA helicase